MTYAAERAPLYPFTAIVGQERMKRALLLNAIDPRLGGVLVRGGKGTAKSTAARALTTLFPEIAVPERCPYSCDPARPETWCDQCREHAEPPPTSTRPVHLVELPIGATEDRLVGSLNIEEALTSGERVFEPGLLAAANRGVLYVDEVNLLGDHLVDLLLDVAAMGRNYVEREGISISHPAEFILIGTMNPEEGEVRPQLLDRFALSASAGSGFTIAERSEVVKRRLAFEANAEAFAQSWSAAEDAERQRIQTARDLLPAVRIDDSLVEAIATVCFESDLDGLRGDIVMHKAARALAAYEGRDAVNLADIREAAELALPHRQRRQPFQQPQLDTARLDEVLESYANPPRPRESQDSASPEPSAADRDDRPDPAQSADGPSPGTAQQPDERFAISQTADVRQRTIRLTYRRARQQTGRAATTLSDSAAGRQVGARVPAGRVTDLAVSATLRAAAPHQTHRRLASSDSRILRVEVADLREKVRQTTSRTLTLFVVDASGSLGAERRMEAAKGAVVSLLLDSYRRRDRVGLIAFRGTAAELVLAPTSSVDLAHRYLADLPTGGRTPLGAGLRLASEVFGQALRRDRRVVPRLVLISDGSANIADGGADPLAEALAAAAVLREQGVTATVIDAESGQVRLGLAAQLAAALGTRAVPLGDLV